MSKKLPDLSQFYSSERVFRHILQPKLVYTDGIQYLAEEAGAYWLIDLVASYVPEMKRLRPDEYLFVWVLKRVGEGCVVSCHRDPSEPAIIEQEIEYTDFPEDFQWYVGASEFGYTMMLKSEY